MFTKNLRNKIKNIQHNEIIKGLRFERDAPKNFGQDIVSVNGKTVDVYIYDVIAFPWIEAVDIINQVPENAEQINLYINSPGGSVFEGTAIYNFLKNHNAKVSVRVDGLAASMASIIAMAGDEISIYDSAFFMIHDPWVTMSGNAEELLKEVELLEKIEGVMAGIYSEKSGKTAEEIRQLMHDETWFTGTEAKSFGFAGTVESNNENAEHKTRVFDLSMFDRSPINITIPQNKNTNTEEEMNKSLRKSLEAKGLSKDATEDEAWEFLANQLAEEKTESGGPDLEAEKKKAAEAEKKRQADIRHKVSVCGLDENFAKELIDQDISAEDASNKIFAQIEKDNKPVGTGTIQVTADEKDKFRAAAVDGMLMRSGQRVDKPAPGAESFRGFEISGLIKEALKRSGANIGDLHSRRAVADFVTSPHGSMSTSDFSNIFRDVANKTLLKAYQEAPATWRPWTNVTSATDFKTQYGISLSEAPDLQLVNEHGEYKEGSLSDNQESYSVYKYGRILTLSWEMIINDDLRAFTRLPQLLGNAARRKESDLVYNLLTSNPTMNDGVKLFHATHSNYVGASGGDQVSSSTLDAGRKAMRQQKGMEGSHLDLRPRFLLVPTAQETDAEILLRSRGSVDNDKNSAVVNPWYGRLEPIAEPRLDDDSENTWYLVADPAQIDTIEVSYLEGYEQPTISENVEFTKDALGWKVRHVFGCGVMDYRGFYQNADTN